MAGDDLLQLTWHLSGGTSNNDPDLSLGGARSNFQIRHGQTTVSTAGAVGDVRIYLASVDSWYADSVCYFRDGVNGGWAARVTEANVGSGWIDLLEPLPASIAIGDQVWLYNKSYTPMPFGPTTAVESALGSTQYIGLYAAKPSPSVSSFRLWLESRNNGPVQHEIAASNDNSFTLPTIPDRYTEPDLSGMLSGGGSGRWTKARAFGAGFPIFDYSSGNIGFWLKRTIPANSLRCSDYTFAVVAQAPSGFLSKLVLYWDTVGFTPLLTVNHAPTLYLRGGARFRATVIGQESGLPVPNVPVRFEKTAGPGTLTPPPAPSETDEDGEIFARYAAPVDVGEIGQTVTIEAQV